jgi:Xaa-Pro dipeptidase
MSDPDAALYHRHIDVRQRHTEHALSELGYDALLIHSGRPDLRFLDDQGPAFQANAPFVSWVPQPFAADSLLEVRVGEKPRLWFYQPDDFWHVSPDPPADWWGDAFDIRICRQPEDWHEVFRSPRAFAVIARPGDLDGLIGGGDLNPDRLMQRLHEDRTRKTEWECHCLAEANRLGARAHKAAADAFRSGGSELEIHLAYLAAAGLDQSEMPYNSIVCLNEHAAVLHYQYRSPARPANRHSFLIDAGAHCHGYASDITRTWAADPASEFAELIDAMDEAQQRLVDGARAGQSFVDLHRETQLAVAGVLEQFRLVAMSPQAMVESGVSGYFMPHGLGHFLGVQVHDVAGKVSPEGEAMPPPEAYPALRLTRELASGNVVTIEPGLYFIPSLLERLKGSQEGQAVNWDRVDALSIYGGIRIEDNVIVTDGAPRNLTRSAWAH